MQAAEVLEPNVLLAITNERDRAMLRRNPLFHRFIAKKNSALTMKIYLYGTVQILGQDPDSFVARGLADPDSAQAYLEDYITREKNRRSERTGRTIGTVTIVGHLAPVRKFTTRNRLVLDWDALMEDLPRTRKVAEDRPPTLLELREFMKRADVRSRFVCPALVSLGGRIGAFYFPRRGGGYGHMRLKDVTLLDFPEGKARLPVLGWMRPHAEGSLFAGVEVYPDENEHYAAFFSVESVDNLRTYLDARVRANELLRDDSPVVREVWNDRRRPPIQAISLPVTVRSLESRNQRIWISTGVKKNALEGGFKANHGFRKFFDTEGKRMAGALIEDEGKENHVTEQDVEILKGDRKHYNKPYAYLQKVFVLIMPRLLIDAKYEERFLRKKEAERFQKFREEDVKDLRLQLLEERTERQQLQASLEQIARRLGIEPG